MRPRLNVAEAALAARKHEQTVRRALEAGQLHGTQRKIRGRWTVREDCLEAWCDGVPCEHQAAANAAEQAAKVVDLRHHTRSAS